MLVIFQNTNINSKGNKKFTLSVTQLAEDSYSVTQRTYNVFKDGREIMQYEKNTTFGSVADLLEGDFTKSRQGKIFIKEFNQKSNYK
ncbi:TPA: hypothetical protein ACNOHR_005079 [Enterobacter hormaechei]|uniref:hypothetical protein n=1 Tax=Enterobacter roggenkampii TaxID=1812935 RepID=UPI0018C313FB|nr:hypothetical protein [Enterobacter roggenkampii]EKY4017837.1 hypothetical protein [Enterobacter roggenkampii]ELJ8295901.1 hypothetical protein [Enterobacter roggenkampii]MBG0695512.1 hypothetical protein [Enterobacter roggenkampii]